MADARLARRQWLDAVRAIAAAMVFVHHAWLPGLASITFGMRSGLVVFFVLSGFLLYEPFVVARAGGPPVSLAAYAVRRIFRIYPAFIVASLGISLIDPWRAVDIGGTLTMTGSTVLVAWTLAIELSFYALLPFLAWGIGRFRADLRPLAILGLAVISLVGTLVAIGALVLRGIRPTEYDLRQLFSYLWAFTPGMLVAELRAGRPTLMAHARHPAVVVAGVLAIATAVLLDPTYPNVLPAIGSALLVAAILERPEPRPGIARVATAAGAISYSFYLWHLHLIRVLDQPPTWIGAATTLVLSVAIAATVYVLIERPMLALARRLSRARVVAGPSRRVARGPELVLVPSPFREAGDR